MHPPQVSVLHLQQSVLFKNWSGWGTWPQVNTRGPPYPLSACKECPAKCTQASMQKQTNLDPNKGTLVKFDRQLRFNKERQKSRIFQVEQVHSGLLKTDGQDVLWIPPSPFFPHFALHSCMLKCGNIWKHQSSAIWHAVSLNIYQSIGARNKEKIFFFLLLLFLIFFTHAGSAFFLLLVFLLSAFPPWLSLAGPRVQRRASSRM